MSTSLPRTGINESFDLVPTVPKYSPFFPISGEGIRTHPLPGVRCPACAERGEEVWVVPGLLCPKCRAPAPDEDHHDSHASFEEENGE
ncbi:hypothetical protein VTK56DRAFT_835 [Thermocarpiscus australiensis]